MSMNKAFQRLYEREEDDKRKHKMRPREVESELIFTKKIEKKIKGLKKKYEK